MFTDKQKFLIWVFVLVLVCIFVPNKRDKEHFYNNYSRYCSQCGYSDRSECSDCVNCGFCITRGGYGECVPGDKKGPYFREDCYAWEYNSPRELYYYYHIPHIFPIYTIGRGAYGYLF